MFSNTLRLLFTEAAVKATAFSAQHVRGTRLHVPVMCTRANGDGARDTDKQDNVVLALKI